MMTKCISPTAINILIWLAMNDNTRSMSQSALKCEALTGTIPNHLPMVVKTLGD